MSYYLPNTSFPQQVSLDQAGQEKCEIAFSNGASFPTLDTGSIRFNWSKRLTSPGQSSEYDPVGSGVPTNAQRPSNPAKHPEYTDYDQRLRSYARWTLRHPDPMILCEAGFFFTNEQDLVRCCHCGISLTDFSEGIDPLMEHVRYSPDCPFLIEYLGTERLSAIKIECQTQHTTRNNGELLQQFTNNEQCRHPEYNTVQARISSFAGWPRHLIQTPRELAEAGLYYTGFDDHVRCFMCDGGLRRWDPEDVPWTEHCRWFPHCSFAREMKGSDFIALVQASEEHTSQESENAVNGNQISSRHDLTNTLEHMTLSDPGFRAVLQEHKDTCVEMGYQLADINDAVEELIKMGNVQPNIEQILDMIDVRKERRQREIATEIKENETPLEENKRLKSIILCMTCGGNQVNALFLPCSHHRLCMECAKPLTKCPVCENFIRQKIRTYLA